MKIKLIALFISIVLTLSCPCQTYIKNVTLLDVEDSSLVPGRTVRITDGLISGIFPDAVNIPAGALVIDGKGKFLMPGMTDAHIHFFQTGGLYTRPDAIDLRKYVPYEKDIAWGHQHMEELLRRYTKAGITTVIDVGSTFHYLAQRDSFRNKSYAPTIYMAGPLITPYEPLLFRNLKDDEAFNLFSSASDAVKFVRDQLPHHPDLIKIWYILTGKNLEEQARNYQPIVKAIVDEAHSHHLRVAVHATERIAAQLAVESGCDYLVHGIDDEVISEELIGLLKKKKIVVCPTLISIDDIFQTFGQNRNFSYNELTHANPDQLGSLADLKHLPDSALIGQYKILGNTLSRFVRADSIRMVNLKKMVEAGITIAAGTDAGTIGTEHAAALFTELKTMQESGLSNWQIIQSATIGGARAIGKEKEFGSIAQGKRADLILLDANPLDQLENLQKISLVIDKGHLISPDTLVKATPESLVQQQLNGRNFHNSKAFLEPFDDDIEIYDSLGHLTGKGKEYLGTVYSAFFEHNTELHAEVLDRTIQQNIVIDHGQLSGNANDRSDKIVTYHIGNDKIKKIYYQKSGGRQDSVVKSHQLIKIEQALMDALPGDTSLWSACLDKDWYIITEDGTGYGKANFLKTFSPFPKGFSGHIKVVDPVLTFHDKMAVIHYVADEYEEVYGQKLHTSYATANTYYQTDSSWKMIGSQIFEIPRLPAAIKLPSSVLSTYTGNYRLTDSSVAHISLIKDTLFIQKNKGKREALLPETNNVFFRKSDTRGRKIFIKNDKGQWLMLERRNGNDLIWTKEYPAYSANS